VMGGKLELNRLVACREIQQAEQELAAQRLRVLTQVRLNFYEVLFAERSLTLAEELVRLGEQGLRTVDDLLKAEQASRVDLLQARVEVQTGRILLEKGRNRSAAAWRRLTANAGMPPTQGGQVTGKLEENLPQLSWDESLANLLANSPEIADAHLAVDRARWAVARARAEPIPNLDLLLSVQYDNHTGNTIGGVQAGVPLPVFNRNQGGIARAQAEVTEAEQNVRRLELRLRERLAHAFERYSNAKQEEESYSKSILPDARLSLDLVSASYREGQVGFLSFLTAQRTYFQTALAHLEALRQLRETSVEIQGLLLRDR